MQPGGITEIICHFAGYLRISEPFNLPRPVYDLGGSVYRSLDDAVAPQHATPDLQPELASVGGAPVYLLNLPNPASTDFHGAFRALKFPKAHHDQAHKPLDHQPFPHDPVHIDPGVDVGFDGGIVYPPITIDYEHWAAQRMIYADQTKVMLDNDTLLVTGHSGPGDMHGVDVPQTIDSMVQTAMDKIPIDLHVPLGNQVASAEFIHDRDVTLADAGQAVNPGLWINGDLQAPDAAHPALPHLPAFTNELPMSDGTQAALKVELGSNIQVNETHIVDANEAAQTLVVFGNYYDTNAILQTNSLMSHNDITYYGPPGQTSLQFTPDQANNVADFVKQEAMDGGVPKLFGGPNWHVDFINDNFYDIKTLVQQNWMSDNDVTVQTTSGAYERVLAGGNEQSSFASYFDGKHYDVIIVSGDYHNADIISQTNVLLDDNVVQAAANLGPGHGQFDQQITWGGNTLLNDATIKNIGTQGANLPISNAMQDLVSLLGKGDTTSLDPSYGFMLSGSGSSDLNILYVSGDYYDVNVVAQINVLSNVDTAIQYLPDVTPPRDGARTSGDALAQSVSAGANTQINTASITDVGTLVDQHIGGQYYSDSILIQTNLISSGNDKVTAGDPAKLVPEIVAFTGDPSGQTQTQDPHHTIAPVKDILSQSDVMGSLTH